MTAIRVPVPEDASGTGQVRPGRPTFRRRGRSGDATGAFPPLRGLLPLALLLVYWELRGSDRSPYFPPPSTWLRALGDLWDNGTLWPAAVDSLTTFCLALAVASVLGTLGGLLVGAIRSADKAMGPTLEFARAMPPAAVVPIATLLMGYDETMKVAVVTFAAVWSILLNTRSGVRQLDPVLIDTARSLRLGRLDSTRKCVLPALLPSIFLGIRVAAPVALTITLLVEILTQVGGVGALIAISQRNYLSARVYGLLLVAGLFNLLVNGLVSSLEAYAFRHRPAG